jgi:hypothetical protein
VRARARAGAFPKATFDNQCQYFDPYWRPVPMIFGGRLVDAAGSELASGAALAVGDQVRLRDGTLSAILPSWMTSFGYDAGMLPAGDSTLPVKAWLALEATNTAEGVQPPVLLNTVAEVHIELGAKGGVDESRSWITVRDAPLPELAWTATGGEVQVRQAAGDGLPALPIGRNGAPQRVRGSLYAQVTLHADGVKLDMDCLQATQLEEGARFADVLPGALDAFRVPGWSGSAVTGRVDADLLSGAPPVRAAAGEQAVVKDSVLRLRLTQAQRDEWVKDATTISGSVDLFGARSGEGSQTVTFSGPVGAGQAITLPLPDTRWTAASDEGIDVRGGATITLDAGPRRLVLTRVSAGDAYPFARVLRPPPPPPAVRVTPTPAPTATPVPTTTPQPKPPAPKLSVRSTKLKLSGKRVPVSLACASAPCKGTLSLRTTSGRVLTSTAKYSLAAGRKATVRLTLSASGRRYLRSRQKVATRLTVKPSSGSTSTKKLTLRR